MRLLVARTIAKLVIKAKAMLRAERASGLTIKEARTGEACVVEDVEALEQG